MAQAQDPSDFNLEKTLTDARDAAYLDLRRACSALDTAVQASQRTVDDCSRSAELRYQDFIFAHTELCQCLADRQIDVDFYGKAPKAIFDHACQMYGYVTICHQVATVLRR